MDEALRDSESDLLYTVQMRESEATLMLYLLFEHQSQPDAWMRFRLLKYMCRIWDESFKERPEQSELPAIVPVVFYQGERAWRYSTEFVELFAEGVRAYDFLYVAVFVLYLATTQERRVVNEFAAQVREYAPEAGGDMLTYAEELRQEGKREGLQKGEIKGKVETIESLLAVGAEWTLITQATGITPETFERLKKELEEPSGASHPGGERTGGTSISS